MAQVIISNLPPLPNGTGSGTPKGTDLTPATDTTDTTEAATGTTKKYTRASELNFYLSALGLTTKTATLVASTGAFTVVYANGAAGVGATLTNAGAQAALSIDGVTMATTNRVLVKDQATPAQNGIYTVTNIGSGATNWVMTRATDYDQATDISTGDVVLVNSGTINASRLYEQTGAGPFTMGTTDIIFTRFSLEQTIFTWHTVTGTSQAMTANNGYFSNNAGLVTLSLPSSSSAGDQISVCGQGIGGWSISQGAGQQIHIGASPSTLGVTGSVSSSDQYDSVNLVCQVANTIWTTNGAPQSAGLTVI